jgi:phosphoserine phosphatase RsbU/P
MSIAPASSVEIRSSEFHASRSISTGRKRPRLSGSQELSRSAATGSPTMSSEFSNGGEFEEVTSFDGQIEALHHVLEVALDLAAQNDLDQILRIVTQGACNAVGCERASLFLCDDRRQELYTRMTTELEIAEIRVPRTAGVIGWVATTLATANLPDPANDARWSSKFDLETGFHTRNILAIPVVSALGGHLLGVLQLLNFPGRQASAFDERVVRVFAAHAATALERTRLQEDAERAQHLRQSIEVARQIQLGFLPRSLPNVPNYEFAAWWQPAEYVSGDYYDWFNLRNGELGVSVGDVCGHGLGASLLMASVRAMIHVLAKTENQPVAMLELLREAICPDLHAGRFLTFLLLSLDIKTHIYRYSNAGHQPALQYHAATQSFSKLHTTCLPIGFPSELSNRECHTATLEPGDLLVLGTDGVIEVRNGRDEMFGIERLKRLVASHAAEPPAAIVRSVEGTLREYWTGLFPPDDCTLMLIKRS